MATDTKLSYEEQLTVVAELLTKLIEKQDVLTTTILRTADATKIGGDAGNMMIQSLLGGSDASKKYRDAMEAAALSLGDLNSGLLKTAESQKIAKNAYKAQIGIAAQAVSIINKERAMRQMLDAEINRNAKSYISLGNAVSKGVGYFTRMASFVGASTISIGSAKDVLVKYNQSMFNFSRIQQIAGRGMGDITKAFDTVSKRTTFSKKQFAEFMDTSSRGWKGIAPTSEALADVAATIQDRFGPSVEKAGEVMKSLLDIQNKFPSLANTVISSSKKISGNLPFNEKDRKMTLATLAAMRMAGQITKEGYLDSVQMMTKTTGAQKKKLDLNKSLGKATQSVENAQQSFAETTQGAMIAAANAVQGLANIMATLPQLIMAAVGAYTLLNKQIMLPNLSNMLKGGLGSGMMPKMGAVMGKIPGVGRLFGGVGAAGAAAGRSGTARLATESGMIAVTGKGVSLGMKLAKGVLGGAVGAGIQIWMGKQSGEQQAADAGLDEDQQKKAGKTRAKWGGGGALAGGLVGAFVGMPAVGAMIGGLIGDAAGKHFTDKFVEKQKKAMEEVVKDADEAAKAITAGAEAYMEALQNYEAGIELNQKNLDLLNQQLEVAKEFATIGSGMAAGFIAPIISGIERQIADTNAFLSNNFGPDGTASKTMEALLGENSLNQVKTAQNFLSRGDVKGAGQAIQGAGQTEISQMDLDIGTLTAQKTTANPDQQTKIQEEINQKISDRAGIMASLISFQNHITKLATLEGAVVKANISSWTLEAEAAEKVNSLVETRLDTERKLMESAQFGMGASISMMQKQVDLAQQMIKIENDAQQKADNGLQNQLESLNLSKAQAKAIQDQIKNAKSLTQVQAISNKYGLNSEKSQMLINSYYMKTQEIATKVMQQQQKIYDITKEIREGYLGAIQAMSVGFGEFEKIIGTQDVGVEQIIDQINKYTTTGENNIGNTFALGGKTSQEEIDAGIGTGITGEYTASGGILKFIPPQGGGDSQEARNSRIRGYDQSLKDYRQMQSGEGTSKGVGTGLADEKYLMAFEDQRDAVQEGTQPIVDAINNRWNGQPFTIMPPQRQDDETFTSFSAAKDMANIAMSAEEGTTQALLSAGYTKEEASNIKEKIKSADSFQVVQTIVKENLSKNAATGKETESSKKLEDILVAYGTVNLNLSSYINRQNELNGARANQSGQSSPFMPVDDNKFRSQFISFEKEVTKALKSAGYSEPKIAEIKETLKDAGNVETVKAFIPEVLNDPYYTSTNEKDDGNKKLASMLMLYGSANLLMKPDDMRPSGYGGSGGSSENQVMLQPQGGYNIGGQPNGDIMAASAVDQLANYDPNERMDPNSLTKWNARIMSGIEAPEPARIPIPIMPGQVGSEFQRQDNIQLLEDTLSRDTMATMKAAGISRDMQRKLLNVAILSEGDLSKIKKVMSGNVTDQNVISTISKTLSNVGKQIADYETVRGSTQTENGGFMVKEPGVTYYYNTEFPFKKPEGRNADGAGASGTTGTAAGAAGAAGAASTAAAAPKYVRTKERNALTGKRAQEISDYDESRKYIEIAKDTLGISKDTVIGEIREHPLRTGASAAHGLNAGKVAADRVVNATDAISGAEKGVKHGAEKGVKLRAGSAAETAAGRGAGTVAKAGVEAGKDTLEGLVKSGRSSAKVSDAWAGFVSGKTVGAPTFEESLKMANEGKAGAGLELTGKSKVLTTSEKAAQEAARKADLLKSATEKANQELARKAASKAAADAMKVAPKAASPIIEAPSTPSGAAAKLKNLLEPAPVEAAPAAKTVKLSLRPIEGQPLASEMTGARNAGQGGNNLGKGLKSVEDGAVKTASRLGKAAEGTAKVAKVLGPLLVGAVGAHEGIEEYKHREGKQDKVSAVSAGVAKGSGFVAGSLIGAEAGAAAGAAVGAAIGVWFGGVGLAPGALIGGILGGLGGGILGGIGGLKAADALNERYNPIPEGTESEAEKAEKAEKEVKVQEEAAKVIKEKAEEQNAIASAANARKIKSHSLHEEFELVKSQKLKELNDQGIKGEVAEGVAEQNAMTAMENKYSTQQDVYKDYESTKKEEYDKKVDELKRKEVEKIREKEKGRSLPQQKNEYEKAVTTAESVGGVIGQVIDKVVPGGITGAAIGLTNQVAGKEVGKEVGRVVARVSPVGGAIGVIGQVIDRVVPGGITGAAIGLTNKVAGKEQPSTTDEKAQEVDIARRANENVEAYLNNPSQKAKLEQEAGQSAMTILGDKINDTTSPSQKQAFETLQKTGARKPLSKNEAIQMVREEEAQKKLYEKYKKIKEDEKSEQIKMRDSGIIKSTDEEIEESSSKTAIEVLKADYGKDKSSLIKPEDIEGIVSENLAIPGSRTEETKEAMALLADREFEKARKSEYERLTSESKAEEKKMYSNAGVLSEPAIEAQEQKRIDKADEKQTEKGIAWSESGGRQIGMSDEQKKARSDKKEATAKRDASRKIEEQNRRKQADDNAKKIAMKRLEEMRYTGVEAPEFDQLLKQGQQIRGVEEPQATARAAEMSPEDKNAKFASETYKKNLELARKQVATDEVKKPLSVEETLAQAPKASDKLGPSRFAPYPGVQGIGEKGKGRGIGEKGKGRGIGEKGKGREIGSIQKVEEEKAQKEDQKSKKQTQAEKEAEAQRLAKEETLRQMQAQGIKVEGDLDTMIERGETVKTDGTMGMSSEMPIKTKLTNKEKFAMDAANTYQKNLEAARKKVGPSDTSKDSVQDQAEREASASQMAKQETRRELNTKSGYQATDTEFDNLLKYGEIVKTKVEKDKTKPTGIMGKASDKKGSEQPLTPALTPEQQVEKEKVEKENQDAQNIRDKLSDYSGKKDDPDYQANKQEFLYKQVMGNFARQNLDDAEKEGKKEDPNFDIRDEVNRRERLARAASKMEKTKGKKLNEDAEKRLSMEDNTGEGSKFFTSFDQKKGLQSSGGGIAAFQSEEAQQRIRDMGIKDEGGSNGSNGVYGKIVVQLSEELMGEIQEIHGIVMEISRESETKGAG